MNGDNCNGCYSALDYDDDDLDLCPSFYDIHDCSLEWDGETSTAPAQHTVFTLAVQLNSAPPGQHPSIGLAALALLAVGWARWE